MKITKILLIDDDPDDRLVFKDALWELNSGIECDEAKNGIDACRQLRAATLLPNIIFLDLNMPRVNGYEFLAQLKGEEPYNHIPVIIYTTTKAEKEKKQLMESGAAEFCSKTDDFDILKAQLQTLLTPYGI